MRKKVIKRIKPKHTQTQRSTGWARKRSVRCLLFTHFLLCLFLRVSLCHSQMYPGFVWTHSIRFGFVSQSVSISLHPINFHSESHGFWFCFCFCAIQRFYLWWVISIHSGTTWGNFGVRVWASCLCKTTTTAAAAALLCRSCFRSAFEENK